MGSVPRRIVSARPLPAVLLACALSWAAGTARGQTAATGPGQPTDRPAGTGIGAGAGANANANAAARGVAVAKADGKPAVPDRAGGAAPDPARAREPRREPSEAFQESIRKTVEKRRQRRARRAQGPGSEDPRPVGAIVPWLMPPALIIRHTPQVHDEVGSLLDVLRH